MKTQAEPVASTSSVAAPSENSLKRKDRDEDEAEEEHQHDDDEKENPSFGENEVAATATATPASKLAAPPAKKKVKKEKKPLVKKVAVWRDIQEWKEGDDPLGRFPVEVLDMIISIDSDLDLRDHLALSATCRFFRTCYRDVVFQVLYHSKNPYHRLPGHLTIISSDGGCHNSYSSSFFGPVARSYNEARHIFSSSAMPRDGWELRDDEWRKDGKNQQDKERATLINFLEAKREARRNACRIVVEREDAERLAQWKTRKAEWDVTEEKRVQDALAAGELSTARDYGSTPVEQGEWGVERKMESLLQRDMAVHGDWVKPAHHISPPLTNPRISQPKRYNSSYTPPVARDPWESAHRYMVADVVNLPRISKTEAKSIFKVSDRELMSLPTKFQYPHWKRGTPKHYLRSAVEALSLRAHGGATGHGEYLDKLQVRKEKAHATRVKNGTLVVAKPKTRYGWEFDY